MVHALTRSGQARLSLLLAAISGAAGLAHQLLWVRRMVDVLGANAGTFTRVIAAFFLGLSAGSWLAGRMRASRPWRSVALAEFIVAALALVVVLIGNIAISWQASISSTRILEWLLPLLLITPPAMAMGTVIPLMIRGVGSARGVLLYGVNTFGGIGGMALVLAWALPALGLTGASLIALSLNIIVALLALLLDRQSCGQSAHVESATPPHALPDQRLFILAFASGFLVLAAEVIFQHQFAQFFVSSYYSSAMVLTLVLVALSAGALLTPWVAKMKDKAMPCVLALSALAFAVQPFVLIVQRGGLVYLPFKKEFTEYLWNAVKLGLPACSLLLLPAALIFPMVLKEAGIRSANTGHILAINGLGGWCGAEVAERFLAPTYGLWWSMALLASGYAACLLSHKGNLRWWLGAALLVIIPYSWKIDSCLPFAGLAEGETLVAVSVGREGVVGVVRGQPDDWRIIFNNNYTLGGSRAQFNQERQTLLPMLLHGQAKRVATLGVATGSSLAGATLDPILEQGEGIELSPIALHFAQGYFAPFNRDISHDPRIRFTVGDARIVIAQRPATYDVIEGDLFLPWRTGEGRLFSREHFQNVRAALKPGGLYCQWLPMFQLTRAQYDAIARTFREVFPEAWLVRGDLYAEMPILGLVGGRSLDSLDWTAIAAASARARQLNGTRDPLLRHSEGLAMCVVGPLPKPPPGPINTLANAWLEWDAARNLIGLREPWFVGVPYAEYLRAVSQNGESQLPASLREAHANSTWFHALEIAGSAKLPQAAQLAPLAHQHLPPALINDLSASWREWPMKYRPALP
jgi:spermidine synthase